MHKNGAVGDESIEDDDLLAGIDVETTEEVDVPKMLIDQVIGQDHAVEVIRKAAKQRRHVLLIGTPGTGKSMLARSMAELLPHEELQDILVYPNPEDKNNPKIRVVPAGKGKEIVEMHRMEARKRIQARNSFMFFLFIMLLAIGVILAFRYDKPEYIFWALIAALVLFLLARWSMPKEEHLIPKLLVSNAGKETAPFVDATGAHSGALLGDVRHDPYQCIIGSMRIQTADGRKVEISEIVDPLLKSDGERELSDDEVFEVLGGCELGFCVTKVRRVFKRYFCGDVFEINTRQGHRIIVTGNHPVAVFDGKHLRYKLAEELSTHDICVVLHYADDSRAFQRHFRSFMDFRSFMRSLSSAVLFQADEGGAAAHSVGGGYEYDEITSVRHVHYEGYVYNLTTETGNYIVENILTHNSGGLETPAHERVEAGAIHKAHKGVLFIDEVNMLRPEMQQALLTAMQEKEFPITGQSERSAGAMVKTDPVPCDFIMVAAGNLDAVTGMHPALRSRIKGYGYEIYMHDTMEDTLENRRKLVRFIAQEVKRDGKIPHFDRSGIREILREARRRTGRRGHLTLILRDLGGLVRVAGDIARAENAKYVTAEHVIRAKEMARSIEQQVADEFLEKKREYKLFRTEGYEIGRVNGLAIVGDSGIVLPIIAEVTPAQSKNEGKVIATGRLQEIAREAVQNVSAVFKKLTGKNLSNKDIHIQFIGTYEGIEGDSASISIATAVISAIENIPVDQSVAMTGSLSVRGDVLPVGGVTQKIEAAAQAGIKKVLIPQANIKDVLIEDRYKDKIEIVPVSTIEDVLELSLVGRKKKKFIDRVRSATAEVAQILDGVVEKTVKNGA